MWKTCGKRYLHPAVQKRRLAEKKAEQYAIFVRVSGNGKAIVAVDNRLQRKASR
jgi:hypothetical protein